MSDEIIVTAVEEILVDVAAIFEAGPAGPSGPPGDGTRFYDTFADFPVEGVVDALYVDKETGATYLWDGVEYVPTAADEASQAEAEAGTEAAIRSWSPVRIWEAITAKLALLKTILGQYDTMPTITTGSTSETVAMTYNNGGVLTINCTAFGAAQTLTLTAPDWPSAATNYSTMTIRIITGANNPTIAVPSSWTAVTTVASKKNIVRWEKWGAEAGRHEGVVSY
jgi:hypothetical protein